MFNGTHGQLTLSSLIGIVAAMSDLQLGAADPKNLSASEGIDLTDQGS